MSFWGTYYVATLILFWVFNFQGTIQLSAKIDSEKLFLHSISFSFCLSLSSLGKKIRVFLTCKVILLLNSNEEKSGRAKTSEMIGILL